METNTARSQAAKLLDALEKERAGHSICLGKVIKTMNTTQLILTAEPNVQMAFVQLVVETFAKMGAATAKNARSWWQNNKLPYGGAEVSRLILNRKLPISDDSLAEMFEQLAGMGLFVSAVGCLEHLVRTVEKRAKERPLSPRLRKAIERVGNTISGKKLSPEADKLWRQEEWSPMASDRKLAQRIEFLLQTT